MNLCNFVSAGLAGFAVVLLIVVCASDNSVGLGDEASLAFGGVGFLVAYPDIGLFEVGDEKTKDFPGKIGETFQAAQAFTIMAIIIFAAAAVLALFVPMAGACAHAAAALFSLIAGCLIIAVVYVEETDDIGQTIKLVDICRLSYGGFFALFCAILGCAGCCLAVIAARPSATSAPNEPDVHVVAGVPVAGDAEKQDQV